MPKNINPSNIFKEYQDGTNFKAGIGQKGLYEQTKINERFYSGDQWYGAKCGNDRPLVRQNIIKRIGDYKISLIGSAPVTVNYTADGIPNTADIKEEISAMREKVATNPAAQMFENEPIPTAKEINYVMNALSDYFKTTSERLKFNLLADEALKDAYISGTGVVYTYWDADVMTGLYADEGRTQPIKGDIASDVIDIENVYFGDPNEDDIQKQPFIILAQRKSVSELKREAKKDRQSAEEIEKIVADSDTGYMSGDLGGHEPAESKKVTVLTKLWKEWNEDGTRYVIKATRVTKTAVIRKEWNIGVRIYPLAAFSWQSRQNCAYGESEVTYLVPNQIAINRMLTASVWAVMVLGMPLMVVNGDIITEPITNEPGQIISVHGDGSDMRNAIAYVTPPTFEPNFDTNVNSLITNTLTHSGANDAALGNMRPDNTSAIIAVREAATMPLQVVQNRYYQFCEDIARIWAEFWVMQYGDRSLKIEDENGIWYMPFKGDRYKDLIISVKVDVGASTLWSEAQSIQTLDNLFDRQVIDVAQYLQRMPKGIIPDVNGLIKSFQQAQQAAQQMTQQVPQGATGNQPDIDALLSQLSPEERQAFDSAPDDIKQQMLMSALGGGQ